LFGLGLALSAGGGLIGFALLARMVTEKEDGQAAALFIDDVQGVRGDGEKLKGIGGLCEQGVAQTFNFEGNDMPWWQLLQVDVVDSDHSFLSGQDLAPAEAISVSVGPALELGSI